MSCFNIQSYLPCYIAMKEHREILQNFIVFEGLDGSGTTTQMKHLKQRYKQSTAACWSTSEPTSGFIGTRIREILSRREKVDPRTLALLFAADRNEHLYSEPDGIIARISEGEVVICDRYLFSSLAYQSVSSDFDYIYALNSAFPLPEHLVFLDVPPEICEQRRSSRPLEEIFENLDFQGKALQGYEKAFSRLERSPMSIHKIDGTQTQESVAEKVWRMVSSQPI